MTQNVHPPCRRVCFHSNRMAAAKTVSAGGFYIGVDVGTGSARAGISDGSGRLFATHVHKIKTWNYRTDYYEQSSDDIWNAVAACVKQVLIDTDIPKEE